jgi:hypothetical protein
MSKESTPELTKSWVFVDSAEKSTEDVTDKATSGVEEVTENEPQQDSDTDSISVISESGGSYKTDEEEFTPAATTLEKVEPDVGNPEIPEKEPEITEREPEITEKEPEITEKEPEILKGEYEFVNSRKIDEKRGIEKLVYFATSAACAIILIGFSIAIQQYLRNTSDVNNFISDHQFVTPCVQNLKSENVHSESPGKIYAPKRKNQFKTEELKNKVAKLQEDNEIRDRIAPLDVQAEDNDLRVEGNLKSKYKLNKNKSPAVKSNKENCDVNEKQAKNRDQQKIRRDEIDSSDKKTKTINDDEQSQPEDETYDKKIEELKIKENYLRKKEEFLIEKEHDLLKKEIKLKKEKEEIKISKEKEETKLNKEKEYYEKNKHDKKVHYKKRKVEKEEDSSEEEFEDEKRKFRPNKQYSKEYTNPRNKKYKHKEDTKEHSTQKRQKFVDEHHKKRNISGQWYINLHEGRDSMRQKKRASFKRNKAHWYFQWMVDRARLRVK